MCQNDEAGTATPENRMGDAVHIWVWTFSALREEAPVGSARTGDARRLVSDETPVWAATTPLAIFSFCVAESHMYEIGAPAMAATKPPKVATRTALSINAFRTLPGLCQPNDLSIRSSVRMESRVSCTDPFGSRPSSMAEMNSRSINSIPLSDTATSLRSIWFSRPS